LDIQDRKSIRVDASGMLYNTANPQSFLNEEIHAMRPGLQNASANLLLKRSQGELDFSALLIEMKDQAPLIQAFADDAAEHFDSFVLLGIGGSALGPQAVHQALRPYYYNELTQEKRNQRPRFYVVDNIDPVRFSELLSGLDLNKTLFNVVSKSGNTSETMAQFLIVRERLKAECGDQYHQHIVVTTDREKGNLAALAESEGYRRFEIPQGIGGRFSELTPVGLLPAAVCGIDILELMDGAIAMDERVREETELFENPAQLRAALAYLSLKQGKTMSVFMPYADGLKLMADWYAQLWAESLGKRYNRQGEKVWQGQTPIKALGVTDQHSQVQLYVEGPNDKVFTFVTVEQFKEDILIPKAPEVAQNLQFLGGHRMSELLHSELIATKYALTLAGRLHQTIVLPELTPFTVGQLLLLLQWETAYMGELLDVNAFDQPGVEEGKIGTYALMGKPGFAKRKVEIEAWIEATQRKQSNVQEDCGFREPAYDKIECEADTPRS